VFDGIGNGHSVFDGQCTVRPVQIPATCPACGGALAEWRSVAASDPALNGLRFKLARCGRCGSAVTLGDIPAGLYASGAYRPGAPRLHRVAQPVLGLFDAQRLGLVRSLVPPPARLLDAGAGRGRFVAAALAAGYDAFGVEPSGPGGGDPASAPPILRTTIEDAQIEAGSVDVVTLWHVLEHLDRPGRALERAASWLAPGGGLVIGVPNLASLQARLGGERWYHLDVPRHRVHFTPAGLTVLLRSHGFAVHTVRHRLLEHNAFGMWQSLLSRVTRHPSYVYNLLKRNAPLRSPDLAIVVAALPALPFAAGLELAAGAARRGGTIAVVARRVD
jgi:SAM-dependent methyltransferase